MNSVFIYCLQFPFLNVPTKFKHTRFWAKAQVAGAFVCHRLKPVANEQIGNKYHESLKIPVLFLCKKLIRSSKLVAFRFPVFGFQSPKNEVATNSRKKTRGSKLSGIRSPVSGFQKIRLPRIHEKNKKLAARSSKLGARSFPVSGFPFPVSKK